MSLVGTRPILQDELRQYELHHRARIAIKRLCVHTMHRGLSRVESESPRSCGRAHIEVRPHEIPSMKLFWEEKMLRLNL